MLDVKIDYNLAGSTMMEKLIAQALSKNSSAAARFVEKSVEYMDRMKKAALRVTAAHARKKILDIYETNSYGWKKHQKYNNWFGEFGAVSMTGLIAANKPKKTTNSKGVRRKKGYSRKSTVWAPKEIPLGGRLVKSTRYKVTDDNMVVGVLNSQQDKVKKKMQQFQDGGNIALQDPASSRRYLAAIGIYLKRSTTLKSTSRPLYDKLITQGKIKEDFQKTFLDMLLHGKRVGK